MFEGVEVTVIVPARNEGPRIGRVLAGIPAFVDHVIVVDDASTDDTASRARDNCMQYARISLISHEKNRGVGAAIVSGYRHALRAGQNPRDTFCVMAGDGQMDPADLARVALPIARGHADYVKGDRLSRAEDAARMPLGRRIGGRALSRLTGIAIRASVHDSQCGYTAISRAACASLDLDHLWPRYGYPNDLLGQLAARRARVAEVPVRSVYSASIPSGIGARHLPRIVLLIARAALRVRGRGKDSDLQMDETSPIHPGDDSASLTKPAENKRGTRVAELR